MINTTLVANTIQPKYSKKLLEKATQLLKLLDFAQVEDLPAGIGSTSVRFFRPPAADLTATGAPAALTEGTAPTNYRTVTMTPIDVALSQRGQVTRVSDVANTVGLLKFLDIAIDLMAEECALDLDTYTRNTIVRGIPATTGGSTNLAAALSRRYAQATANFAGLAGATAANGCITPLDLLDCRTQLVLQRAPTFGGDFVAVVAPQVTRDILNSSEFREVVRQNYADKLFKAEVGKFYNVRIVEATNPFQEDEVEGTFASTFSSSDTNTTGFIYTTQVLGKGAFGMVKMNALGGSPMKPQVIINDKPDKSDPLNQFISAGWKAYAAATVLNPAWGINLRTKSRFA
jgi:N4-gp56 family major capsid protein